MPHGIHSHRLGPPLLAALLTAGPVHAQIVTDGSVGPKVSLHGGQIEIGADLGTRRGDNLFHSFEKFGIATDQTATFTGPDSVRNVISRVTGGEISNIDGALRSEIGQADLYFLNPAGVVFGPNAKLDVPGSFHVSTAHELRFADGARFSALDKAGSGLTVAPPEAFGFLDQPPGRIGVDQSQVEVRTGKTLSLVGGDLDIAGKQIDGITARAIQAENGTVNLASITAVGQFFFSDATVQALRQGNIQLKDHARISASGNGGGKVRIRGGTLAIDNSTIAAENTGALDSAGGIDLHAGSLRINNDGHVSTNALSSGRGGVIMVSVDEMTMNLMKDGSGIHSDTKAGGRAGGVAIHANHLIVSSPGAMATTGTGITSDAVGSTSTGDAGTITVTAGTLELHNGGGIHNNTQGSGNASPVHIQADRMFARGDGSSIITGVTSDARTGSIGNAGSVVINADYLELRNGAKIRSATRGRGQGGEVKVKADHIFVARDQSVLVTGIQTDADFTTLTGDAGTITVTVGTLELHNGGRINSETFTHGKAGEVNVNAGHLLITGYAAYDGTPSAISTDTRPDKISREVTIESTGAAGAVTVIADTVVLRNRGTISSSTRNRGNAGKVTVHANHLLISDDGSSLTGITSQARSTSTGDAGNVSVTANILEVHNGGIIGTSAQGQGKGGSLSITATDTLRLDGSSVGAQTASAQGGDIRLAVGRLFDLHNSTVTTSVAGGTGSGGNIFIDPPLMVLDNSRIEANAKQGAGGNITIRAGQLIRTPDSRITASGSVAGNITITTPNIDVSGSLVVLPGTFLDASSQLRETCASRGGRPTSSIIAGGRGGLPPDPDAPLAASPFGQPPGQQTATGSPTALTAKPRQAAKSITVSGIPQPVLGSPRLTCRG